MKLDSGQDLLLQEAGGWAQALSRDGIGDGVDWGGEDQGQEALLGGPSGAR